MGRRSYAGAANHLALASGYNIGDPTFTTDSPIGWPDGSNGPFQVRINKGQPNEQKVLVASRTGSTFTVSIAAWDGTTPQNHSASEPVELIGSSVDLDEANAHVNASLGVHGLVAGVHVVGDTTVQTLTNKSMSGASNTFTNIPRAASPEIDAALTANSTSDTATNAAVAAETTRATAAEGANTTAISAEVTRATTAETTETTARTSADTALTALVTAEAARATAAEALKAPIASPTFTGAVTLPGNPSGVLEAAPRQYVDARDGKWGVTTASPDGNGNFTITHGLGAVPTTVGLTLVGPSAGNAAVGSAQIRSFDTTIITVRVFTPAGVGFTGSNVTVHWSVLP